MSQASEVGKSTISLTSRNTVSQETQTELQQQRKKTIKVKQEIRAQLNDKNTFSGGSMQSDLR